MCALWCLFVCVCWSRVGRRGWSGLGGSGVCCFDDFRSASCQSFSPSLSVSQPPFLPRAGPVFLPPPSALSSMRLHVSIQPEPVPKLRVSVFVFGVLQVQRMHRRKDRAKMPLPCYPSQAPPPAFWASSRGSRAAAAPWFVGRKALWEACHWAEWRAVESGGERAAPRWWTLCRVDWGEKRG